MAVHRFGNWRTGIKQKLVRAPATLLYNNMYRFVRNFYGIELPWTTTLGRRVVIEHQGAIVIHGRAVIGDDCIIRHGVTLGNRHLNHPANAPHLGVGVNVGAGAKILGAVTVGDKANVGANAVVTSDVAANTTVVGIPARPLPGPGEPCAQPATPAGGSSRTPT